MNWITSTTMRLLALFTLVLCTALLADDCTYTLPKSDVCPVPAAVTTCHGSQGTPCTSRKEQVKNIDKFVYVSVPSRTDAIVDVSTICYTEWGCMIASLGACVRDMTVATNFNRDLYKSQDCDPPSGG